MQHDRGVGRIAFVEPSPNSAQLHNLTTQVGDDEVHWISVPIFVEEVAAAAHRWFEEVGATSRVQRNMEGFVRRRPDGIAPHLVGAPVIT